jgi:Transposase
MRPRIDTGLVTAHLDSRAANHRLRRLARIGVGEIAYRKGRKFLTIVTDHDTGHVVWVREGRTQKALITFLDTLGPAGRERISAISMDMTRIYREAARIHLPQAAVCYDPFHLIKWAGEALDQVHLAAPRDSAPIQVDGLSPAKTWQKVRTTLRAAAENLDTMGKAHHQPATHQAEASVPCLATRGEPARPLPRTDREGHQPAPGQVMPRRYPLEHQRLYDNEPAHPPPLRRHHRRHHPPAIQLPHRRHQRRHPPHPTPRQRLRQPRQPDRNDPHLPWRHPRATANPPIVF